MKRFKRTFKKGNTKAGKDALKILRDPDNLTQMFGENKGKQISKEWSTCCGLCRVTGYFVDAQGNPVTYDGDLVELGDTMTNLVNNGYNDGNSQYIVYVYSPGNFVVLGTEKSRKEGNCTPEYINEQFSDILGEDVGFQVSSQRLSSGEGASPLLNFNLESLELEQLTNCGDRELCLLPEAKWWSSDASYQYGIEVAYGGTTVGKLNWLDDPANIPTQEVMDNYIFNNEQESNWRKQLARFLKEHNERWLVLNAGADRDTTIFLGGLSNRLQPGSWKLRSIPAAGASQAPYGPPVIVWDDDAAPTYSPKYTNPYYSSNGSENRATGWYAILDSPYGCYCDRHAFFEIGTSPQGEPDWDIALGSGSDAVAGYIGGHVYDVNDLPTTGPELKNGLQYNVEDFGAGVVMRLTWVSDDCIFGFCDPNIPTTNPNGAWCEEPQIKCPGMSVQIDPEDCFTSRRANRDALKKAISEFNYGFDPFIWSNYFYPRFQVVKYKI